MPAGATRTIAVFGGSRPQAGSADYEEAYTVGCLLAQSGYAVMNGGYAGTMEASARGAQEHGGRAIGVISSEFAWLKPNGFLAETLQSPDLFARIRQMQQTADGFVVLRGSMGTLAELALVWNLSKIDQRQRKPIVLLGAAWAPVLDAWRQHLAVTDEETALLDLAATPEEAVKMLLERLDAVKLDG
ncbi:MAG: LOG family protein [Chloroflexi bacterium]|nr:LOG family protein [Chloroflexota bacterium]